MLTRQRGMQIRESCLLLSDLSSEITRVKVSEKTRDGILFNFQNTDAFVLDWRAAARRTFGCPLERRAVVCGNDVAKGGMDFAEGVAVFRPELARAIASAKLFRRDDVADFRIFSEDSGDCFQIAAFFQLV